MPKHGSFQRRNCPASPELTGRTVRANRDKDGIAFRATLVDTNVTRERAVVPRGVSCHLRDEIVYRRRLQRDLVRAGIFLHDLGKSAELSAATSISYTDRGQLVGHITIAAIWIQQKADAVAAETGQPFPRRTLDVLQHIILSHHGVYEYGSPKLPAIPEAFFIHYLDNLDAKLWMTANAVTNSPDPDSNFTTYMRSLETRIYRHSGTLEVEEEGEGTGPLFG